MKSRQHRDPTVTEDTPRGPVRQAVDAGAGNLAFQESISAGEAVVQAARAEVGLVRTMERGSVDESTGKHTRFGWERLDTYFAESYGRRAEDRWGDGYNLTLQDDVKNFNGKNVSQHWCGHFALWALKKGGAAVGNWQTGQGIASVAGITPTTSPRPGDVGYLSSQNHHFLVADASADPIQTIDGNTNGGQIAEKNRSRAEIAGFFTAFPRGSSG